uniref:Uncharacterized protein n=1 Tax=Thermocrinis ruber TaxID=75906 RepID=A0A7C5WZL6_9AQUI
MARVKLDGAINVEFEVKYGLNEDLVIKVHEVPVGGSKRVLIGEGDITHVSDKTLSFIGDRIESILKKDKSLVALDGFGKFVEYCNPLKEVEGSKEFHKAMYQTELGTLIMRAYLWNKAEALEEVLQRNLFPLSASGMKEFKAWKKVKEKAKELGWPMSTVKKVEHLI